MPRPRKKIVHLLAKAYDYQERIEFDQLCNWWKTGGKGVCALIGIGGAGKTAIVERFLRMISRVSPDNQNLHKDSKLIPPTNLFVFSFYKTNNFDEFFSHLIAFLKDQPINQGEHLIPSYEEAFELLDLSKRCLLILDGIERVQDIVQSYKTDRYVGKINHNGILELLIRVVDGWLPDVSIIVTSRLRIFDLQKYGHHQYQAFEIGKLTLKASKMLLLGHGVNKGTDSQLGEISEEFGCHALSIDLLGGLIKHYYNGDINTFQQNVNYEQLINESNFDCHMDMTNDWEISEINAKNKKLYTIAISYHDALLKNDQASLSLLQRICLFNTGAKFDTLKIIFLGTDKEIVSGKELAALTENELHQKLNFLRELRLVESVQPESDSKTTDNIYSIHPLVKYWFTQMIDKKAFHLIHKEIIKTLTAKIEIDEGISKENPWAELKKKDKGLKPHNPITLEILEQIFFHFLKLEDYLQAYLVYVYGLGYSENLLVELSELERGKRLCQAFFKNDFAGRPFSESGVSLRMQSEMYHEWALYLYALGELEAALKINHQSLGIYKKINIGDDTVQSDYSTTIIRSEIQVARGNTDSVLNVIDEFEKLLDLLVQYKHNVNDDIIFKYVCGIAMKSDMHPRDFIIFLELLSYVFMLRGQIVHSSLIIDSVIILNTKIKQMGLKPMTFVIGQIWSSILYFKLGLINKAQNTINNARESMLVDFVHSCNDYPPCNLVMAEIKLHEDNLEESEKLVEEAYELAIANNANEYICWSEKVRVKIYVYQLDKQFQEDLFVKAKERIASGFAIARRCGYGLHHIDLLVLQSRIYLIEGDYEQAEYYAKAALFGVAKSDNLETLYHATPLDATTPGTDRGIFLPKEFGLPDLPAATNPVCNYFWGEIEARECLIQAYLLKSAYILGKRQITPQRFNKLPKDVNNYIESAREQIQICFSYEKKENSFSFSQIHKIDVNLKKGKLTQYRIIKPRIKKTPYKDKSVVSTKQRNLCSKNSYDRNIVEPITNEHIVKNNSVIPKYQIFDHMIYITNWDGKFVTQHELTMVLRDAFSKIKFDTESNKKAGGLELTPKNETRDIEITSLILRTLEVKKVFDKPGSSAQRTSNKHFILAYNNNIESEYYELISGIKELSYEDFKDSNFKHENIYFGFPGFSFLPYIDDSIIRDIEREIENRSGSDSSNIMEYPNNSLNLEDLETTLSDKLKAIPGHLREKMVTWGEFFVNKLDTTESFGTRLPPILRARIVNHFCHLLDKFGLKTFVVVHCDLHGGSDINESKPIVCHDEYLDRILMPNDGKNLKVPVILAHCGILSGDVGRIKYLPKDLPGKLDLLMSKYGNLFLDISWSARRGLLEDDMGENLIDLIKKFSTRVVIGSDYVAKKEVSDMFDFGILPGYNELLAKIYDAKTFNQISKGTMEQLVENAVQSLREFKWDALYRK